MKILILEDEQRNAMRLIRLLNDIDTTFIIEGPLTNIKEAVDFFQSGKTTDLILADIRLTDGLSFEALKYAPATVPIIFTTAYDEYAVQAFKFNSFDYLLKPLDADELEAAIDKATKAGKNYADENLRQLFDSLQKNQFRYRERFLLPYRDGYKTVRVSDINHIETENKTVYLRLNNGTSEVVNMSMDELEQQLNPDCFFRANRQYIINIEYVLFLSNYFGGKLCTAPQKLDTFGVFFMKYNYEIRLKAVKLVLEGGLSVREAGCHLGCGRSQVHLWVTLFERHGLTGLKLRHGSYSAEFKLSVLKHMHQNHLSLLETAVHFGIPGPFVIRQWERLYQNQGAEGLRRKPQRRRPAMSKSKTKKVKLKTTPHEELLKELEYLRAENAYLKKLQALVEERIVRESGKEPKPSKD